jgi:phosphoribosyl 1,2-cyclic phosphodiesterase
LYIRCWGTRGSIPRPLSHQSVKELIAGVATQAASSGAKTLQDFLSFLDSDTVPTPIHFGGNTACTEIGQDQQSIFVDMGTGFREAGGACLERGIKEIHVFVTHMHWDHIMGLPFFIPVYTPGHKIHIYHVHKNAPDHIRIKFNGVNFPLNWDQLSAEVVFHQLKLYRPEQVGCIQVTPFALDHPGGCFGYRAEVETDSGRKSAVVGFDGEFKRLAPKELGQDLEFYQDLDAILFDSQYEMAELASRFDWGHCSPNIGVDLALREGINNLVFTHHDPWANEAKLHRMYRNTCHYLESQLNLHKEVWKEREQSQPNLFMAYDGFELNL